MKTMLVAAAIVGVSYFLWSHYFSRSARIERAYVVCIDKFNTGINQARPSIPGRSDPSAALARGMGDVTTSMVQGMTSAMGGAMCGMIKDTCRQDFNGPVCQAALGGSH